MCSSITYRFDGTQYPRENAALPGNLHARFDHIAHKGDPGFFSGKGDLQVGGCYFSIFKNERCQFVLIDLKGPLNIASLFTESDVLNLKSHYLQSHVDDLLTSGIDDSGCKYRGFFYLCLECIWSSA